MREMSKFPALIYLNNYILINDIWDFLLLFNAKNKAEANLVKVKLNSSHNQVNVKKIKKLFILVSFRSTYTVLYSTHKKKHNVHHLLRYL